MRARRPPATPAAARSTPNRGGGDPRFANGGRGMGMGTGGEGGLILPGQPTGGANRGRGLILPGQSQRNPPVGRPDTSGGGGGMGGPGAAPMVGSPLIAGLAPPTAPAGPSPTGVELDAASTPNFRPPPGFMEAGAETTWLAGHDDAGFDMETALGRLRAQAAPWHVLAALLPPLARAGIDAMAVEVDTGLERKTQAVWGTAAQVFASLQSPADGALDPSYLPAFDSPDGAPALNELRNLARDVRVAAAAYLAERGADPALASTLARAYREWERRRATDDGFTQAPGDVMAYKFYRDAVECRREEDKDKAVERAVAAAVTGTARARVEALRAEAIQRVVVSTRDDGPALTVTRLAQGDTATAPLGVACAALGAATAADLAAAASPTPTGAFGLFSAATGSVIVLPAWSTLASAVAPAAVEVRDCAAEPAVRAAALAVTDDDVARLRGPGLLIVDRVPPAAGARPPAVLVSTTPGGPLSLARLAALPEGAVVVASVLYVLLPARVEALRESEANAVPLDI
jgi:hypothetical protein